MLHCAYTFIKSIRYFEDYWNKVISQKTAFLRQHAEGNCDKRRFAPHCLLVVAPLHRADDQMQFLYHLQKVSSRTYLVYLYKHWSGTFAPTNVFTFNALFKETLSCTGEGARAGINTQLYTHVHAFTHVMHSCTLKYSHFRTCWTVVHFKHTHFKDVLHSCSLKCTHLRTWAKIAKAKP